MLAAAWLIVATQGGCGLSEDNPPEQLSDEEWVGRADGFCSDGIQEATALPLPSRRGDLAADAAQRAEIVTNVRDGLVTLGASDGIDEDAVTLYIGQLSADAQLLEKVSEAASAGGDAQQLNAQLDESAGQAASSLGLADCATFASVIARTP